MARTESVLERAMAAQIRAAGLPEPQREVVFALPRRFRADFFWPTQRLILEVDGGTWTGGRHVRGAGVETDAEKTCLAAGLGYRLLRVTGAMVRDGRALRHIERALAWGPADHHE